MSDDYHYDIRVTPGRTGRPGISIVDAVRAIPDDVTVTFTNDELHTLSGPELAELMGFADLVPGAEPDESTPVWMLSFCNPDLAPPPDEQRPGGPSWLGTAVVQAHTAYGAITRTHRLGINPGGEVGVAGPLPAEYIAAEWRDRLLTQEEVEAIPQPEGLD